MGCKIKSNVKLDYIQDFEMMFERMRIDRPRESAVYYTILLIDCPKEFSDFLKIAEELTNITRRPLETGRSSLLKNGLIAKVLFSNKSNENFGRESYFPVNPKAIWEIIKDDLKHFIAEDTYNAIENHFKEYNNSFKENFNKYGIKLQRSGNVTLQYSGKWILYTLLNNCLDNKNDIKILVGGEKIFEELNIKYFKKFLELDTKIQLITDLKADKNLLKDLKNNYGDKLELRFFSEDAAGTLRNYIFGKELALNGIKILPETNNEPSFIGTAYVNLDEVEIINKKFNSLWNLAKPIV
jgi:hypothetical protein